MLGQTVHNVLVDRPLERRERFTDVALRDPVRESTTLCHHENKRSCRAMTYANRVVRKLACDRTADKSDQRWSSPVGIVSWPG